MALASFSRFHPPPPLHLRRPSASARASAPSVSPLPRALIEIEKSQVIACLRAPDGKLAMEAACAALSGGISVLEIVMSTPGVLEVIKGLQKDHPSSVIGVGTVLNAEDARKAIKAGAQFLMSPCTVMVLFAYTAGARIVKVYPVSMLGGDKYISALKKPFPHIPMVASQGIATDSIERYIGGGASAVVLSDAIFEKEAMRQRNFDEIKRLAYLATLHADRARRP
ncbi:uncharacterized protein [Elaeis guineensis]|uniref:Uncharacterized protein LOC105036600 n=1 Tax=Elaeis guineensis var. tenera TaxID=51953 RepID=A0A6J0PF74_ELAGV|nr:uncharacterized protein LOC105036600 [Elaeis guineensis]